MTPEWVILLQQSASHQARQRMIGATPRSFGEKAPELEEERVQSPITGEKAPESVEEAEGGTMAHKARDKQRKENP